MRGASSDRTIFCEALIRHRAATGVTLAAIANGSGVPLSIIGKPCRRQGRQTSAENALRIARFLGCALAQFVGIAPDEGTRLRTRAPRSGYGTCASPSSGNDDGAWPATGRAFPFPTEWIAFPKPRTTGPDP